MEAALLDSEQLGRRLDLMSVIAGVPKPAYLVQAGWGQGSVGLFRYGISKFGSTTDVMAASSWSETFNGTYDDLSAIARSIEIDRGRDNDITQFKAGQSTISMRDAAGIYNPYNPASPLVIAGTLDTDKPIRVSAILAGVTYPLYYGFITDIEGDPSGRGTVQITAVDFLDKLNRLDPILNLTGTGGSSTQPPILMPGGGAGMTTGQILGLILDWFQWQDPAMRNLGTGDTINAVYTHADGTASGLDLVNELMEAERGLTFVAAGGAVTYINRQARYGAASLGTIDQTLTAFPVGKANTNIINSWTVQRTDMAGNLVGVAQTAADDASGRAHGVTSQTITTPFLNSDNQALGLAQYLLIRTKSGMALAYDVPLSIADTATMIQALSREIGDRVTLDLDPLNMPAISGDFYIEAIKHTINAAGPPRHATTWRVSQVIPGIPFRFGTSRFGGTDTLTY